MTLQPTFTGIYDSEVFQHLAAIDRKYHSLIRRTIEERLFYEPEIETRNRKPLQRPSWIGATWELRCGIDNEFRIFYRTDSDNREVFIRAIAVKKGNRLFIGKEELYL